MDDTPPDGEPADGEPDSFPRSLRIAGAIWIAYGAALILAVLGVVVLIVMARADGVCVFCPCAIPLFYGLMFLDLGMKARGKGLADLQGPAVWSFMAGFLHFALAVLVFYLQWTEVLGASEHAIAFAIGGVSWIAGFGLFAAGLLADRAESTYLPPRKRPRE